MTNKYLLLFFAVLLVSCGGNPPHASEPRPGIWRMELDLGGNMLPFLFDLKKTGDRSWAMDILNGEEVITVTDIILRGDSFFARPPIFDSELRGMLLGDSLITGLWHDFQRTDYHIPFTARTGVESRFPGPGNGVAQVAGQWRVRFGPGTPGGYDAVGLFEQHPGGRVTGTFLTETGDHRHLEGIVHNDTLRLSAFDGSHAFLYTAALSADSLHGTFRSGNHWQQPWAAVRDPAFSLRDPDSLVVAREKATLNDLHFPDLKGDTLSLTDARFKGKVLLVQVMGSWCPNCVDETRLLNELHAKHHAAGLEVVAIAFEKHKDAARAVAGLERFREALDVQYTVLYGGNASKPEAAAKLPFLSDVLSWPTTVFVDRTGAIRRVRTGFTGPGAGERHTAYKQEMEGFVEGLLHEPVPPGGHIR